MWDFITTHWVWSSIIGLVGIVLTGWAVSANWTSIRRHKAITALVVFLALLTGVTTWAHFRISRKTATAREEKLYREQHDAQIADLQHRTASLEQAMEEPENGILAKLSQINTRNEQQDGRLDKVEADVKAVKTDLNRGFADMKAFLRSELGKDVPTTTVEAEPVAEPEEPAAEAAETPRTPVKAAKSAARATKPAKASAARRPSKPAAGARSAPARPTEPEVEESASGTSPQERIARLRASAKRLRAAANEVAESADDIDEDAGGLEEYVEETATAIWNPSGGGTYAGGRAR